MNFFKTTEQVEIKDYPYGYTQKTTAFYSIEFKEGHGFRLVFQTINPKTGRLNNPKKDTYSPVKLLYINDDRHCKSKVCRFSSNEEINNSCKFLAEHFDCFTPAQIKWIYLEVFAYTVATCKAGVIYGGANKEISKALFMPILSKIREGIATGQNIFSEISIPVEKIEASKDPDYNPFVTTQLN